MKNLVFLLIFSIPVGLSAQNNPGDLYLGAEVSYDFNLSDNSIYTMEHEGYTADYPETNFTAGIFSEYVFSERLSGKAGLNYTNRDFMGTAFCEVCDWEAAPLPETVQVRFLELPLCLKYFLVNQEIFQAYLKPALVNSFSLTRNLNENAYFLSGSMGLGASYWLSSKTALGFRVNYRHSLSKINYDPDFNLVSLGLGASIKYRLN